MRRERPMGEISMERKSTEAIMPAVLIVPDFLGVAWSQRLDARNSTEGKEPFNIDDCP
jgi:hypothetical protein